MKISILFKTMSIELNTEILNQSSSTSCFIHEPKGNQILNIDNTNFISTLGLAQKILLEKPILKRGVHINEDFDLVDPKEEEEEEDSDSKRNWEEEDSDSKRNWEEEDSSNSLSNWTKNEEEDPDAKVQLQEHLLEQQQYDLIWSPFGQRMVTPKDFKTFEEPVELIIKPVQQEPVKQEPVKIKQNLFEKLLQKYKKKADNINAIIERQEAERQEEAARQQQEAQNTFYDFAELADCFEANDEEEEEEEKQEEQKNTNSDPKRNWRKCIQLQENLDLLPDRLSKPTDKRYLQEWQIMEQVWFEEHQRIIIEHTENCEFCQSTPPKKLRRCEECNTIEPIEPIEY